MCVRERERETATQQACSVCVLCCVQVYVFYVCSLFKIERGAKGLLVELW